MGGKDGQCGKSVCPQYPDGVSGLSKQAHGGVGGDVAQQLFHIQHQHDGTVAGQGGAGDALGLDVGQRLDHHVVAADEAVHRDALVREVHHRIKNNLQGISGMLRQFAQEHPETADIINQAITQVRSVAVLHGLQGRTSMDTVRLCELTSAIASDVQSVWQTPIAVDIPSIWTPGIIAEKEAVPIALVLNELLVNAVKHGGKAQGHVSVTLRKGQHEESIQVSIRNSGRLRANTDRPTAHHAGLQLVGSLMPHEGASLIREQQENEVLTRLELEPPVVHLESRSLYESA